MAQLGADNKKNAAIADTHHLLMWMPPGPIIAQPKEVRKERDRPNRIICKSLNQRIVSVVELVIYGGCCETYR
jgi:hypothetical protein